MADYPVTIDLADHHLSDKFIGLSYGPVLINGVTPTGTLARTRMHLIHVESGDTFKFDSQGTPDGTFTIDNATTWTASIAEMHSTAFVTKAGKWKWSIETYEGSETLPLTIYKGVLTVHPDVTIT